MSDSIPAVAVASDRLRAAGGASAALRAIAVVPVFNGEAVLARCLAALLESDLALPVVVVDDGSSDCSLDVARRCAASSGGRVHVLALGVNRGFASAVNRGVCAALSFDPAPDALVLVNQDCFVKPGWLAPLLAALDDPAVAVAGARLLDSDGETLQHAGARIEPNGLTTHLGRGSRDVRAYRDACDVDYVCGALLAFRAPVWERFGPLDEGYAPAYFEEVDFCVRVRRAGLRVVYVPGAEAIHVEASTSGSARTFYRRYHSSRLRFVVRHLVRERGAAAWLRSELGWLLRMQDRSQLGALMAAYARVPALVVEARRSRT